MRFIELSIEAFQALERAHVQLGPGLNVLYGPNDLGKSTLAGAIRAALLVQPRAAEAQRYSSWYADSSPRVTLTFQDDQERFWQIRKTFGSGASAELLHSKDGKQFAIDCKAREVEEKVRALLQWGIAAPGGKGAPRGLPESFLAKVLLAAQTDVDEILTASLEKDQDDTGKLRLRNALATLAQDPLFKRVLDVAKQEYDVYFTANGRPRRHKGSKLVEVGEAVKKSQSELDQLRHELEQSREIEDQVRALHEACLSAEQGLADAEAALATARRGLVHAQKLSAVESQLAGWKQALAEIAAQAARVGALEKQKEQLAAQLSQRRSALEQASAEHARMEAVQRAAEAALQRASSDAAEQARKLRAAELEREAAQLRERKRELEARREELERVRQAIEARDLAVKALERCQRELSALGSQLTEAQTAEAAADHERDLARGVLAYGRWRAAETAAQQQEHMQKELQVLVQKASALEAEAKAQREQHTRRAAELSERRGKLPTPERFKQLDGLRQELERAEAALGGGMSIRVTPRRSGVSVRALVDRVNASEDAALGGELVLEAQRSAQLQIADLVEIEITAGAAERRREVAELRPRWETEVTPVLERAAVATLESLEGALAALQQEDAAVSALRQQADARSQEARGARERAALLEKQLESQAVHDVAARRAAIGSIALELLEPRWRKFGAQWEVRAEEELKRCEQLHAAARAHSSEVEQRHKLAAYQLSQAQNTARERAGQADTLAAVLKGRSVSEALGVVTQDLGALAKRATELEQAHSALAKQAGAERAQAEQALAEAKTACERVLATRQERQRALEQTKSELDTAVGESRAQAERLASMDRPAAEQRLQLSAAELEACPSAPLATEADVAEAEHLQARAQRGLAQQREELHKAEGALTRVGGAQLQDRLQQAQEALDTARAREHTLLIDAQAWKLLSEALVEAETEESEHLGVALGRPVGEKLQELTRGRYRDISFDQHMTAARLKAEGATPEAAVLDALSVGTRNQLATLIRLTIASQLKSAIILDDHLVHTDPARLRWFRDVLRRTALDTQVVVLTCRPEDYLDQKDLPTSEPVQDLAGGSVRAVDLSRLLQRWAARP